MTTTWTACQNSFVYPTFQGMCKPTAEFPFSKWKAEMNSADFNENYMVMVGKIVTSGRSTFWPADDIQEVLCEGTNCSLESDWSGAEVE